MNYHQKKFRPISNSENGVVTPEMIFVYEQIGDVLSCIYQGKQILRGHLLGKVHADGKIEMRYQQLNTAGEFMTGICQSTPELLPSGKIRLPEKWKWTSGDQSEGESILEEI